MDDMPPWVVMQTDNPVLRGVMVELMRNETFRAELEGAFKPRGYQAFVGDQTLLDNINRGRRTPYRIDPNTAGVALMGSQPMGGIAIDVDRIHSAVQQDSVTAKGMVRDAVLHEFAHLLPVARGGQPTGDPRPGDDIAAHPAILGENRLRGLLGLPAKTVYGLMGAVSR